MNLFETLVLALGGLQVLSPDRWAFLSLYTFQRKWGFTRMMLFTFVTYVFHLILGLGLFYSVTLVLDAIPIHLSPFGLWIFSAMWIGVFLISRFSQYGKLRDIFWFSHQKPNRAFLKIFLLMGPSEWLVPLLLNASARGMDQIKIILIFGTGTLVVGFLGGLFGRFVWSDPYTGAQVFSRLVGVRNSP